MNSIKVVAIVNLLFSIIFCGPVMSQVNPHAPLFPKNHTNVNEQTNELIVVVGQKLNVTKTNFVSDTVDPSVVCKYKILQRVYGRIESDTIEFVSYDHSGIFPFAEFATILLFVTKTDSGYQQVKYTYDEIYETLSGRWASPYKPTDYSYDVNKKGPIKPVKIDFKNAPTYSIKGMSKREINIWFPNKYYRISQGQATALCGNYVEELFVLKKRGVLSANGLF